MLLKATFKQHGGSLKDILVARKGTLSNIRRTEDMIEALVGIGNW